MSKDFPSTFLTLRQWEDWTEAAIAWEVMRCVCVCVCEFRAGVKNYGRFTCRSFSFEFSLKNLKNKSLEGDFSLGSFLPRFVLVPPGNLTFHLDSIYHFDSFFSQPFPRSVPSTPLKFNRVHRKTNPWTNLETITFR